MPPSSGNRRLAQGQRSRRVAGLSVRPGLRVHRGHPRRRACKPRFSTACACRKSWRRFRRRPWSIAPSDSRALPVPERSTDGAPTLARRPGPGPIGCRGGTSARCQRHRASGGRRWRRCWAGLILAGSSIGGGEWLLGPAVAAQYGGALLWVATLSILAQFVYNIEASRYALFTGEPIMTGKFRTLPGPGVWLAVYMVLDLGALLPYQIGSVATPLLALWLASSRRPVRSTPACCAGSCTGCWPSRCCHWCSAARSTTR